MAKDNLLKDAIADAKAVKDTAIANAMLTLQETFKPKITEMLTDKLRKESITETKLASSGIGTSLTVDDPAPKEPAAAAKSSSKIEDSGLETDTFGEGVDEEVDEDVEVTEDFGGPPETAGAPSMPGDEFGDEGGDEFGGEEDLDLEAIIRELEAELMGGGDEMGGMDMDNGAPDMAGAPDMDSDEDDEDVEEALPFGKGNPHIRPEGFTKVEAGTDINAGIKTEAEKAKTDDLSFPVADAEKKVTESEVEEEVDLEEILREMGAEDELEESEEIASENVELKRSLREHREVIQLLRNRINEVTLLNSKLMYTTKIFRSFNLSEGQKKKIVEQFDRATNLRETKLVYATLSESLHGKTGTATPRRVVAKITEGASKSVGSTRSKSPTTVLAEGDVQVARMQKLAGIVLG